MRNNEKTWTEVFVTIGGSVIHFKAKNSEPKSVTHTDDL